MVKINLYFVRHKLLKRLLEYEVSTNIALDDVDDDEWSGYLLVNTNFAIYAISLEDKTNLILK